MSSNKDLPLRRAAQVPLAPPGLTYGASVPSSLSWYVLGSPSVTLAISTALSVCATRNVPRVWLSLALSVYVPEKSGLSAADSLGPHSTEAQISIETVEIERLFEAMD